MFFFNKIKCKRYFDENTRELDLPGVTAELKLLKGEAKAAIEASKLKTSKKITVPLGMKDELIRLDLLQFSICSTINTYSGKEKRKKTDEYLQIMFQMFNKSSSDPNSGNKTIMGVNKTVDESLIKIHRNSNTNLKKYLDDRNFRSTDLPDDLTSQTGYIIWPVALLPSITYIHNAQMQLIKLFIASGWKLVVIIGDCGKNNKNSSPAAFITSIENILKSNGVNIENDTIALLSDYYKDTNNREKLIPGVESSKILGSFHNISESMEWKTLNKFIKKNYDEKKQQEIDSRTVLNNLQSLLTWSLVATIVKDNEENKPKAIIIAGEDEQEQWDFIARNHSNNKMGVIYIRELKKEDGRTLDQSELHIRNQAEMNDKLKVGNMAEWLFTHFVELPKYLSGSRPEFCKISQKECEKYANNCIECLFKKDGNFHKQEFDKNEFVKYIYPIANPANSN